MSGDPRFGAKRSGLALTSLAACFAMVCCERSPESKIRDTLERVAHDGISGVGSDLRVSLCGWRPARTARMELRDYSLRLSGGERGTGDIEGSLVADSGYRCQGRATFQ